MAKKQRKVKGIQQYLSGGDRRPPVYRRRGSWEGDIRRPLDHSVFIPCPSKPYGLPRLISNSYTFWIRIYLSFASHTRRTWETFSYIKVQMNIYSTIREDVLLGNSIGKIYSVKSSQFFCMFHPFLGHFFVWPIHPGKKWTVPIPQIVKSRTWKCLWWLETKNEDKQKRLKIPNLKMSVMTGDEIRRQTQEVQKSRSVNQNPPTVVCGGVGGDTFTLSSDRVSWNLQNLKIGSSLY